MTWYFESFSQGQRIELAPYMVTEKEIIEFAKKYDPQFFHTDPKKAEQFVFGGLIASGWMTSAVCMRMQCDRFLSDSVCLGSPGVDNICWIKPVRPNDELSGFCEITEVRASKSKPDRGVVFVDVSLFNQNQELVLTMKNKSIFKKRDI